MSDGWLALTWISVFATVGAVIAVWLLARARTAQTRATAEANAQYQQLLLASSSATEGFAQELSRLDERLANIEKLLRDVG